MDKPSKILLILFLLLSIVSISATYIKTMVEWNFIIIDDVIEEE